MPHIRFTVEVDCDDQEPSRIVPALEGDVFEYRGESDEEIKIGSIRAFLVLRGRAVNEGESLFDAMDSIHGSVLECYEALFDIETGEWNQSVEEIYKGGIPGLDVLFIQRVELDATYRGKGIGAAVVRETIRTFASSCGLVACKPFALQYEHWEDEEHKTAREAPGFEERRLADFAKVTKFWTDFGFSKLSDSDFRIYAPQLIHQHGSASPPTVAGRVPRGRRRRAAV